MVTVFVGGISVCVALGVIVSVGVEVFEGVIEGVNPGEVGSSVFVFIGDIVWVGVEG